MSKEAIVEKILSDAQLKADAVIGDANQKAADILASTEEDCKKYIKESETQIKKMNLDIAARSKTVAELDAKKVELGTKTKILDKVFARALEKIRELDKKKYKALLLGMLEEAEDGDVITISKREKDILTKDDVKEIADKKGIKLSLAKDFGDFDGGMILTGKGVDKNFTFEVEVSILREELETQVAKEIFG